jgi:hypothetical protein
VASDGENGEHVEVRAVLGIPEEGHSGLIEEGLETLLRQSLDGPEENLLMTKGPVEPPHGGGGGDGGQGLEGFSPFQVTFQDLGLHSIDSFSNVPGLR